MLLPTRSLSPPGFTAQCVSVSLITGQSLMTIRKTINCRLVSFTTNKGSNMPADESKRRAIGSLTGEDYEALERYKPMSKSKYDIELMLLSLVADTMPLEHPYVRGLYARIEGLKAEYKYLFDTEWVNPRDLERDYRHGDSSF